ncbi:MAG: helix-hairpin-helix domain-containing protein, partial [Anaerolineales bacterium]|nr:helix-hairpin-helix domain-containing protein [Anaerolineales bacterium]
MAEEQTLININLAQAEVLARLPGIGEHLAARIVAHRETAGPFREVMGLTAVSGISERMVQEFANQITVGSLDEPQPEGEANGIVVSIPEPTAVEQEEAVVETVKEEEERPLTNPPVVPPPPRLEMMPPLPAPGMSRRRGCLFAALAVVLGALIGVGVTLGILAAI